MEAISNDLADALSEVSQSFATHAKWAKRLLDLYERSPKPFMKCLLAQLNRIIVIFKRHAPIERLIRFISRLAVEPAQDPALNGRMAIIIIQGLLRYQNSKSKAVRFRVCQTVGNILNKMSDDYELPEELFNKIQDSMLERIKDKVAIVRAMACACLSRLQDPTSADDPVVSALLFALDHDTSHAVRKAALVNIGVSKLTLPHILLRTKDVAAEVRVAAFNVCTEKVAMKALSILQRTIVLYSGLMDRDVAVKKACQETLFPVWIKQCDDSILKLLASLDVQEYEKECETITSFCIGPNLQPPLNLKSQFDMDQELSAEDAFFWRIYCESLRRQKRYDCIENTFPVAVEFAQVLARYQDNVFISSQLVKIAGMMELDEVGRTVMTNLLLSWLKSDQTDVTLIKTIMNTLHRIMVRKQSGAEGESEFITNSLLILADLRDPLEDVTAGESEEIEAEIIRLEDRYTELSKDLEAAKEQLLALKRKKRHNEAGEKKSLIALIEQEMEQIDAELASKESMVQMKWLRLITVTSEMLERVRQTPFSSIADLLHSTILPALKHLSPVIREEAIRCLCLFLLLDVGTACRESVMFVQAICNDSLSVKVAAIKACFDVLLVHNLSSDPSMDEVFKCLLDCLSSEVSSIRTATGQGFAKLFANDHVSDPTLLSKLIIFLFDPLTEQDFELRQTLSVFFPAFCQVNISHRKIVMQAWNHLLGTVLNAPDSVSLRKISSPQLTPFLLYLVNGEGADFSELLLRIFAIWRNKSGDSLLDKFLAHSISMIPVQGLSVDDAHVIIYLAKILEHDLTDKIAIRNILKVVSAIEETGISLPADFDEAKVEAVYERIGIPSERFNPENSDDDFESIEAVPRRSCRRAVPKSVPDDPIEPPPVFCDQTEQKEVIRDNGDSPSITKLKDDDSVISSRSGSKRRCRSPSTDALKDNLGLDVESDVVIADKENMVSQEQISSKTGSIRTRSSRNVKSIIPKPTKKSPKRRKKLLLSTDDSKDSAKSSPVKPRTRRSVQTRSVAASTKKMRF